MPNGSSLSNQGSHRFCHNDSKTFSNSSYHWMDVCRLSQRCISAYRIIDGFDDCDRIDENEAASQLVEQSCSNRIRRHRFRCSVEQPTCHYVTALDRLADHCSRTNDTFSKVVQATIFTTQCNSRSKSDCHVLRRSIEASWTSHLHNRTDLQEFYVKKVPFRSYCDTFHDLGSTEDENSTACQLSWTCLSGQWQCYTGQCIDFAWVLDKQWDCPDGSDEENLVAVQFHATHPNQRWLRKESFINASFTMYSKSLLCTICNCVLQHYTSCITKCSRSCNEDYRLSLDRYDRNYTFEYCSRTVVAHQSLSNGSCLDHFNAPLKSMNSAQVGKSHDFTCWNGTHIEQSRCDTVKDCLEA